MTHLLVCHISEMALHNVAVLPPGIHC